MTLLILETRGVTWYKVGRSLKTPDPAGSCKMNQEFGFYTKFSGPYEHKCIHAHHAFEVIFHHSCYILMATFSIPYFTVKNKLKLTLDCLHFIPKEIKIGKIFKSMWPSQYCLDLKGPGNKGHLNQIIKLIPSRMIFHRCIWSVCTVEICWHQHA